MRREKYLTVPVISSGKLIPDMDFADEPVVQRNVPVVEIFCR